MRNYLLGILSGVAGTALYTVAPALAWYYLVMFVGSCLLVAFSFDELIAILKPYFEVHVFEHDYEKLLPYNKHSGNAIFTCVKI